MRKDGFTLIEVAIVLVILGLIIGLGIPMFKMLMQQNKLTEDRATVKEAKQALIGYAYARGGFPKPVIANGLKLLPYSTLGVRETDANGHQLIYDVNNNLTIDATGGDVGTFCQNVALEMTKSDYPQVQYTNGNRTSVAFVVLSEGLNYRLDDLNANAAKANNSQSIFDDPSHPYSKSYDDIVAVGSLSELYSWCQANGYVGSGGGSAGGGSYSNPLAILADTAAKIAEKYNNRMPTDSELKDLLPTGISYRIFGHNVILRDKYGDVETLHYTWRKDQLKYIGIVKR